MDPRIINGQKANLNFKCIGSNCEDTCCGQWDIPLDKNTFIKYFNSEDSELQNKFRANCIKYPIFSATKDLFGTMKLDTNLVCPFLNSEKLCSIQLKHSADYLCNVCSCFPKITNNVDDKFEVSISLACPEAARLVLLDKESCDFIQYEEPSNTPSFIKYSYNPSKIFIIDNQKQYFYLIRNFTFKVLKDTNYNLNQKLLILLNYFEKTVDLIISNKGKEVSNYLNSYPNTVDTNCFSAINETNTTTQFLINQEIFSGLLNGIDKNNRYFDCYTEISNAFEFDKNPFFEDVLKIYNNSNKQYYEPFIKAHEYILENYLINYVYKELFPTRNHGTLVNSFTMLITNLSFIRFHLIGLSAFHHKLDPDLVVKLISSYTKHLSHNKTFLLNIFKFLKSNNLCNSSTIKSMIIG